MQREFLITGALVVSLANASGSSAAEPKTFLQPDISAVKIAESSEGFAVDVTMLATDFEEMFRKYLSGLGRIDLSGPGMLELEIGRFVAKKIKMRDAEGAACQSKVEKSGEDPSNDEGVLVSLTFQCPTHDVVYDARDLLGALGPRAWQTVTIVRGKTTKQTMVNANSPPVPLASQ
jgi:hypothetical protein